MGIQELLIRPSKPRIVQQTKQRLYGFRMDDFGINTDNLSVSNLVAHSVFPESAI